MYGNRMNNVSISDKFVNDARMAIANLGKTPEMLVKEFEAKRQADSLKTADSLAKFTNKKSRKK